MKLVTHNGRFHYDELLATSILQTIYPNSEIIRTRDRKIIDQGDIVYDVGGEYDIIRKRFDHHQHTFVDTYSSKYEYKLSSAGLIYKHFNEQFFDQFDINHNDPLFAEFRDKIYDDFFLGADCADNGVEIYGKVRPRTIYDMVELYNNHDDILSSKQTDQFYLALDFVKKDLLAYIRNQIELWWNKFKELEPLIQNLNDYILISNTYYTCDIILDVEKKYSKNVLFLIYPSEGKYKIRAINKYKGKFEIKLPLKKEWRGKSQEELSVLFPGAEFVHNSGFIGLHETLEGAINMCRESFKK